MNFIKYGSETKAANTYLVWGICLQ